MKTVGIIGGLGPETTAKFYLQLLLEYLKISKKQRPPVLMWSVPMDLEVEEDLIKRNKGTKRYLPFLLDAAKRLEDGGADFIVIPCNSVHIFIDEIRKGVSIPVLSIVEESVSFLTRNEVKKVILLATTSTIANDLYQKVLEGKGIHYRVPNEEQQSQLSEIICDIVNTKASEKHERELKNLIAKVDPKRDESVLLACTDLQIILKEKQDYKVYDSMRVLLRATVKSIGT